MNFQEASSLLAAHGQSHVLAFWDRLDEPGRTALLNQIAALDFDAIARMQDLLKHPPAPEDPGAIHPAPVQGAASPSHRKQKAVDLVQTPNGWADAESAEARAFAVQIGEAALRAGKVAVVLVAGGQGSRLGFDGPKGCYPIGPVSGAPLFHFHARKVRALENRYKATIPFFTMTSPMNEDATCKFFQENNFFGLDPWHQGVFSQAMWPALTPEGKIILDAPGHIFLSPDGHGGMLAAMSDTGLLDLLEQGGIEHVFYLQVDNPMVDICDPAFLGFHILRRSPYSIKVCEKRDWKEGLGVPVEREVGTMRILEYSDPAFSDELKQELGPDGKLRYLYGSVAIHVFSLDFLRKEADAGLPLHVAHKKVPFVDADGRTVKPDAPNAYKFEKFIFDALRDIGDGKAKALGSEGPFADPAELAKQMGMSPQDLRVATNRANGAKCFAFDREEEFSPVKNAEGSDSPATCRADLSRKWARWLIAAGVDVPLDDRGYPLHAIEIDPLYANSPEELRERLANRPAPDVSQDLLLA